jgi:hypothetical protein
MQHESTYKGSNFQGKLTVIQMEILQEYKPRRLGVFIVLVKMFLHQSSQGIMWFTIATYRQNINKSHKMNNIVLHVF